MGRGETDLLDECRSSLDNIVRRIPRAAVDHGVERALVESNVDGFGREVVHVKAVHTLPPNSRELGVFLRHLFHHDFREVDTKLVAVSDYGQISRDSLDVKI